MFNRKMELGRVLSKCETKLKSKLKTKREILEHSVVCIESLIPYINLVCLHTPVCIKLSHIANSSFPAHGYLVILKKQINVKTNRNRMNNDNLKTEAPPWNGQGLTAVLHAYNAQRL